MSKTSLEIIEFLEILKLTKMWDSGIIVSAKITRVPQEGAGAGVGVGMLRGGRDSLNWK